MEWAAWTAIAIPFDQLSCISVWCCLQMSPPVNADISFKKFHHPIKAFVCLHHHFCFLFCPVIILLHFSVLGLWFENEKDHDFTFILVLVLMLIKLFCWSACFFSREFITERTTTKHPFLSQPPHFDTSLDYCYNQWWSPHSSLLLRKVNFPLHQWLLDYYHSRSPDWLL